MSRIGKKPIELKSAIEIEHSKNQITIKGPKGELSHTLPPNINLKHSGKQLILYTYTKNKTTRQLHGLSRTILSNMIMGVTQGFCKQLEIQGIGYRAQIDNQNKLVLNVGYSHPVHINTPRDTVIEVENNTTIKIRGINKERVGQLAAKIRSIRPPEPYKGKGIRYHNEKIRKKAGKTGK